MTNARDALAMLLDAKHPCLSIVDHTGAEIGSLDLAHIQASIAVTEVQA
jgi:hypothetical protein